jgi:hypothetical protein
VARIFSKLRTRRMSESSLCDWVGGVHRVPFRHVCLPVPAETTDMAETSSFVYVVVSILSGDLRALGKLFIK